MSLRRPPLLRCRPASPGRALAPRVLAAALAALVLVPATGQLGLALMTGPLAGMALGGLTVKLTLFFIFTAMGASLAFAWAGVAVGVPVALWLIARGWGGLVPVTAAGALVGGAAMAALGWSAMLAGMFGALYAAVFWLALWMLAGPALVARADGPDGP